MPCPIGANVLESTTSLPDTDESTKAVIASSKKLRSWLKLQEAITCSGCKFADICQRKDVEAPEKNQAQLGDIFTVLAGLYTDSEGLSVGQSQAAGTTVSILAETFEDFEENDGLDFKMLLNEVRKESQQL